MSEKPVHADKSREPLTAAVIERMRAAGKAGYLDAGTPAWDMLCDLAIDGLSTRSAGEGRETIERSAESIVRIYNEARDVAMRETQGEAHHVTGLVHVYAAGKREGIAHSAIKGRE